MFGKGIVDGPLRCAGPVLHHPVAAEFPACGHVEVTTEKKHGDIERFGIKRNREERVALGRQIVQAVGARIVGRDGAHGLFALEAGFDAAADAAPEMPPGIGM